MDWAGGGGLAVRGARGVSMEVVVAPIYTFVKTRHHSVTAGGF